MNDAGKSKSKGFGKRGGPGVRHPNIVVKVVRREQIDYEKLAAALVELARIDIETSSDKSKPPPRGGQQPSP